MDFPAEPTSYIFILNFPLVFAAVVQPGLGRWPPKPEIPGSNPGGRISF